MKTALQIVAALAALALAVWLWIYFGPPSNHLFIGNDLEFRQILGRE